ncbi:MULTISPECIES: flagellar hook-length control protein FliK [unclassified Pseudomonas]|uniref:flagellar hook-length control protein FliK n=1 Tax=unclassified Pseudomonas TaxID=196821 RepID=UPI0020977807|nr:MULTISPECIES: flagellar hook-length control protein FliK [unclassified Pseudomonas]MCO7506733.1 flagellar hook-length control protein FliK [Pseudomonas sp. VE 267-6A]MCO7531523.1 flagellar hook-length control protein FliK [Pseudomonas sp. 2]
MPVASNPLLQPSAVAKASRTAAPAPEKVPQVANDKAAGFSKVYADQSRDKLPAKADVPNADKAGVAAGAANAGKTATDQERTVADSGNSLPEQKPVSDESTPVADDLQLLDSSLVAGQVTDAQAGAQLIQAQAEAVAPVVQAAAAQLQAQVQAPAVAPQPPAPEEPAFDPAGDVLEDLPALRLALEQNAQAQGTTSAHASKPTTAQPEATQGQPAVNTLAAMLDPRQADPGDSEPGEKGFSNLLDDGLKDLKGASSDTRVDDFAERLSALTQAATPKTANAVPVAMPLNQPLAMHQGGWTEGLVNRVMYLSSQNLKSAEIKLEPAELGRLDIRVHMTPEQQAQITFTSGNVVVREALENQASRLKEMFAEQGLAQPDVNVADQSREQQGSQDGTSKLSGVAARRNEGAGGEEADADAAAQPVERPVVLGSSAVDFYA